MKLTPSQLTAKWRKDNPERFKAYRRVYQCVKYNNDPVFKQKRDECGHNWRKSNNYDVRVKAAKREIKQELDLMYADFYKMCCYCKLVLRII